MIFSVCILHFQDSKKCQFSNISKPSLTDFYHRRDVFLLEILESRTSLHRGGHGPAGRGGAWPMASTGPETGGKAFGEVGDSWWTFFVIGCVLMLAGFWVIVLTKRSHSF